MPELSRFYGILIRTPHFHAYYQSAKGAFSIDPVGMIEGNLPAKQKRLIEAWAEIHQEELIKDWELLQQGKKPIKIKPLK